MGITVETARAIVEVSKANELYLQIMQRAKQGWSSIKVTNISELMFLSLKKNGFTVLNAYETDEIEEWNSERMIRDSSFVISWELI